MRDRTVQEKLRELRRDRVYAAYALAAQDPAFLADMQATTEGGQAYLVLALRHDLSGEQRPVCIISPTRQAAKRGLSGRQLRKWRKHRRHLAASQAPT